MNLLPKNASRNDAIFAQKVYRIYATTSQYLSSYGCAITMVYIYIYMYNDIASCLGRSGRCVQSPVLAGPCEWLKSVDFRLKTCYCHEQGPREANSLETSCSNKCLLQIHCEK